MGKRHVADSENQFETPQKRARVVQPNSATSFAETPNSSPALNVSFTLTREFVEGTILTDLALKDWRIGKPIGKGSFGEIFLASDNVFKPVTSDNAKYVVKIEPHSNGPLFVEIHALLNTAKVSEDNVIPPGMPEYIASGSHYFKNERYRFLILKRYQRDLHSMIRNKRVDPKSVPIIACQILDVLEHLHDKGYVHSDIKAENLMIGKVPSSEVDSLRSTQLFAESQKPKKLFSKQKSAPNGNVGLLSTPTVQVKKATSLIEFSGSNPVRTCRGNGVAESQTYQDMVKSHYLRPLKNIIYRDDSDDEDQKKRSGRGKRKRRREGDTSKSFYYKITTNDVSDTCKQINIHVSRNEATVKVNSRVQAMERKKHIETYEDRIHLIDFGLASKFLDSTGQHRLFCMDQRRAHDGTLEFTSRDAHMGAHARRSDLECLGYNLVFWSQGFLPWKDEKLVNQPEQVHRMKEYFMMDVREMLKMIYGDDCPVYLGDFLHYVGGLTYDERPDYDYLRSLFFDELRRLGQNPKVTPKLVIEDLVKGSRRLTAQDETNIATKINHVKTLMKMGVVPYRESTLHNKTTSPKNLRSKRDSARTPGSRLHSPRNGSTIKDKKEKKFSWTEILSADPDQVARERAEKEFERADQIDEVVIKYSGNPTYAIRELENKQENDDVQYYEREDYIQGYTKPMMDILKKRQTQLMKDIKRANGFSNGVKKPPDDVGHRRGKPEKKVKESEVEEEESEEEADDKNSEYCEEEEDEEEEEEAEEEEDEEEADSGNDDEEDEEVEQEEEEEEQVQINKKRQLAQGGKPYSRTIGRKTGGKVESDSDFINDVEEEEEEEEDESDGNVSEGSEIVHIKRSTRRLTQSESSEQHDSDFNEQESSEYDSKDSRTKRSRCRQRLNPETSLRSGHNTHSKANAGNNTKVPVIARNNNNNSKPYYGDVDDSSHDAHSHHHQQQQQQQKYRLVKRRKSGLRERIRPTDRSVKYHDALQKSKRTPRKRYNEDDEDDSQIDESSCSSSHTVTSVATAASSNLSDYLGCPQRKSSRRRAIRTYSNSSRSGLSAHSRSSSMHNVVNGGVTTNGNGVYAASNGQRVFAEEDEIFNDDDTRDMDYPTEKRKRGASRKTVTFKRRNIEYKGPAAVAAPGATTLGIIGGSINKAGVVAGLRGRRDHHVIRTYSRG